VATKIFMLLLLLLLWCAVAAQVVLSSFHYHMGVANNGESTNIYPHIWRKLAVEGRLGKTDPGWTRDTHQAAYTHAYLPTAHP
jgi:hypothetical protein